MELVEAISAREWNSLNGIFSSDQEADHQLMAAHDFLADTAALNYHHHHHHHHPSSIGASSLEFPFAISTYEGSTSHCSSGTFADSYPYSTCFHDQPVTLVPRNSSLALSEEDIIAIRNPESFLNIEVVDHDQQQCLNQPAVSRETKVPEESATENRSLFAGNSKRSTSTITTIEADHDLELKNYKRNVKPRKNKRLATSDEEDDTKGPISPNSTSIYAGEQSNASEEELGEIASSSSPKGGSAMSLNLNGTERASRGSATDPQSVYARKRREKINERLRILQNLVPNGTKVDISTMLEEAVQYVKFLQLQIKLLSSDDLWMYAPLAYNGMSIGIDLRLAASNRQLID